MNKLALSTLIAASLATTPVLAGNKHRHHHDDDRYDGGRYSSQEYGEVTDVEPIYRSVRIEEPRRECWDERVVYQERRPGYRESGSGAGTLLGAVIGGVIGHELGNRGHRQVSTAAGAIIGAGIGQHASRGREVGGETVERVGYEEVCRTVSSTRVEQRVDGYDVTYRYGGRTYQTTLPYDPGNRIPLDVNVRPVSY